MISRAHRPLWMQTAAEAAEAAATARDSRGSCAAPRECSDRSQSKSGARKEGTARPTRRRPPRARDTQSTRHRAPYLCRQNKSEKYKNETKWHVSQSRKRKIKISSKAFTPVCKFDLGEGGHWKQVVVRARQLRRRYECATTYLAISGQLAILGIASRADKAGGNQRLRVTECVQGQTEEKMSKPLSTLK